MCDTYTIKKLMHTKYRQLDGVEPAMSALLSYGLVWNAKCSSSVLSQCQHSLTTEEGGGYMCGCMYFMENAGVL